MDKDYTDMTLSERLRWWAENCDRCNYGCQVKSLLLMASDKLASQEGAEHDGD
ncbi:hypothetical protein KQI82_12465 [Oscillibacter sp. MSJ-2]|uniref:Uncharacterized protein n=1 Tax=Dysosmobacter acutus TaxID=2841504 RepID=A0ABS6FBR4_9FIRM|nr:hypothetical protein [Dysosmobacter acutus]MBU5626523.1 hypothetical protein [Dysosmobacter acutus]MBU5627723.1 hypothetical protein [Dysosmobacter acutus]